MPLLKAFAPFLILAAVLFGLLFLLYVGIRVLVLLRALALRKEDPQLSLRVAWDMAREEFRRITPLQQQPSAGSAAPEAKKFRKRSTLMTAAEQQFYLVLLNATPEYNVFPKVRVADVLTPHNRWSGDFLSISQKHFDWVICHPETSEPLAAVELDDSSHRQADRSKSDRTKDHAATDAGLVLIRFPWQRAYDPQQVRSTVLNNIRHN